MYLQLAMLSNKGYTKLWSPSFQSSTSSRVVTILQPFHHRLLKHEFCAILHDRVSMRHNLVPLELALSVSFQKGMEVRRKLFLPRSSQ